MLVDLGLNTSELCIGFAHSFSPCQCSCCQALARHLEQGRKKKSMRSLRGSINAVLERPGTLSKGSEVLGGFRSEVRERSLLDKANFIGLSELGPSKLQGKQIAEWPRIENCA